MSGIHGDEDLRIDTCIEYLLQILLRPDSPLPKITSLELHGQAFEAKRMNYRSNRVIDETIRIRYLVTRCFQLVKARPAIKIVLSGHSKTTPTR